MKAKKHFLFFVILALLLCNPLSFYFLYRNTAIYESNEFHYAYWVTFTIGLTLSFLIIKDKLKAGMNIILAISSISILFSLLVYSNAIISLLINDSSKQTIFIPKTIAKYQTSELDFKVEVNKLGLRDREIEIEKEKIFRILCFGDSWTFGWGVQVENSWPKLVEKYLVNKGFQNIEVINCGQPGGYTTIYKKYMADLIPLLRPDLVCIGVLQGDDLAQIYEHQSQISQKNNSIGFYQKIMSIARKFLKSSFFSIIKLFQKSSSQSINITSDWSAASNNLIKNFNHLQKIHFSMLRDTLQTLFKTGNLNPGLLQYYVNSPDRFLVFNDPLHPSTKFCIEEMEKDIREMNSLCKKNNSSLIFINLPENVYVGHRVIRTPTDEILKDFYIKNNKIDSVYNHIAYLNDLEYIQLSEHFLSLKEKDKYFFLFDGHPNKNGYEEIANYIGGQLIQRNLLGTY